MKKPSGGVALFAVVALLSLSPAALAQSASAPAPSAAPAASAAANNPAQQRVEARIKQLHSQLHITAAEEPQWQKFAQTMRDNAREIDETAMQRSQQFPTMTAVENLQSYETLAESHVQHLQKLIPAFQSLYDAMTPEQKKNADEVFRPGAQARTQAQSGNQ
jgi:periplasmic protein CpxP/Spy